jgi:hypothetical protein
MHQPKPVLTKRITVSIEESLRDDLNFLTEQLNINRSSLIRGLILNWMISRKLSFQTADVDPKSQPLKQAIGYSVGGTYDE